MWIDHDNGRLNFNFNTKHSIRLQHNQIHPFMYFTHKHQQNSILKPTTLFMSMGLCPYLMSSIYPLSVFTLFPLCLSLPYFCSIYVSTICPLCFYLSHISCLFLSLPYCTSQLYPTLSKQHTWSNLTWTTQAQYLIRV